MVVIVLNGIHRSKSNQVPQESGCAHKNMVIMIHLHYFILLK